MTYIADHYRPPDFTATMGLIGRGNIVRDAECVVVVGGATGTGKEVDLAVDTGTTVVTLPASGGTAHRDRQAFTRRTARKDTLMPRPHVLLSVATSIDGYIDDTSESRLLLSNQEDCDRVDEVRAAADAILVGANTIRRDNPRLLVRSSERQDERIRRGLAAHPMKVTLTASGDLDASAQFFTTGDTEKLVYSSDAAMAVVRDLLGSVATIVPTGDLIDLGAVLDDLGDRKVGRLMVEGGGTVHTQFLTAGLVDEIHLVIAPFFVGDSDAPRFLHPARLPQNAEHPMTLAETRQIGDVVLLRYLTEASR